METHIEKLLDDGSILAKSTINNIMMIYGRERGLVIISTVIGVMMGGCYAGLRTSSDKKRASEFLTAALHMVSISARLQGYEIDIKIVEKDL